MSTSVINLAKPNEYLTENSLHGYQHVAVSFIQNQMLNNEAAMLLLDMGYGKTIISLTVLDYLFCEYLTTAALVVAPLSVARAVWRKEAAEWGHTRWMRFSFIHGEGSNKAGNEQLRIDALNTPADVYIINYEGLPWLLEYFIRNRIHNWPFNTVIFDEINNMQSSGSLRSKRWNQATKHRVDYRIGLTGTPVAKKYLSLFAQYRALDRGARLGTSVTMYKAKYFFTVDKDNRVWMPRPGAKKKIRKKVKDMTLQLENDGSLKLPEIVYNYIEVDLPKAALELYELYNAQKFYEWEEDGEAIEGRFIGARSIKSRQLAQGAVYTGDGKWRVIHNAKLDALKLILDSSPDESIIIFCPFKHDRVRVAEFLLEKKFTTPSRLVVIGTTKLKIEVIQDKWNAGEIDYIVSDPQPLSYGLNLQKHGNIIIWFGLIWNWRIYVQANARLARQGQKKSSVMVHHIIAKATKERQVALSLRDSGNSDSKFKSKMVKILTKDE